MNEEQRKLLLLRTIGIDRNLGRVDHSKTHQDMMRLINILVNELYETQQELNKLKEEFNLIV